MAHGVSVFGHELLVGAHDIGRVRLPVEFFRVRREGKTFLSISRSHHPKSILDYT